MSLTGNCNRCGTADRNLVVCIDGTSNQYGDKNTNVVELYSRLVKSDTQLTFYNSGIGTYARPSWRSLAHYRKVISYKIDLALALRFEKIVLMAYAWLAENYRDGDRIFLFGFSRGAYQVRTLAAMIAEVGLIHRGNNGQIPFAYELYANCDETPSRVKTKTAQFKVTFSRDVKVHFVGVWDTVSSVGFARKSKLLPRTADGMHHVCYFRHALALHERRVKFLPEYVRGAAGPDAYSSGADIENRSGTVDPPHTKEVWFKGCHSDIGGGAINNEHLTSFGPALRWMSFEALLAGIELSPGPLNWTDSMQTNSMTANWIPMELLPLKRLTYEDATKTTRRPHLGASRVIQPNQLIHATVFDSISTLYGANIEPDPYTDARRFLRILEGCVEEGKGEILGNEGLKSLQVLVETAPGQQSLRDLGNDLIVSLHAMLKMCAPGVERGEEPASRVDTALHAARDGLAFDFDGMPRRFLSSLLGLPPPENYCYPLSMQRAADAGITSVAYAQSAANLVTAYSDGVICSWDLTRGEMGELWASQHDASIRGISVSRDSRWVVSASDDCTLVVWDTATHTPRRRLRTQGYRALSAAFSPDSTIVVCALFNGDVGIWNISVPGETDADGYETLQHCLSGHSDSVRSVAYAPNGQYFVSGSDDTTLRLWDMHVLQRQPADRVDAAAVCVGVLSGHADWVRIVAFSPGGELIASGSDDGSVRLWDVREQILLAVIQWHDDPHWLNRIMALAFSPSGEYLAAASLRDVIHVVRIATHDDVVAVRNGHGGAITALAFAPDGSHVVSGTNDGSIEVWDRVPEPQSE